MQFKHSLHFWAKSMKNPGPSDFRMFRIYSAVRFMLVFFSLVGFLWIIRSNAIHGCSKKYSFLPSRKNARLSSDIRIKSNISTSYLKKITRFSGNIRFPQRANLSDCGHVFGRISIFIAIVEASFKTRYRVAQESINCYVKTTKYSVLTVNLDTDERVQKYCGQYKNLFYKKHCAAAHYLHKADWMLVLDGDTGVVNPNHCIEEYIDDRVDLVFYERFFNWEIASGNYLVKNTTFAKQFLLRWAKWETREPLYGFQDNGALQIHILETVNPNAKVELRACAQLWKRNVGYESYMAYVTCIKLALGAVRVFPNKIRILRRAHGWVRDGRISADAWCENDFMLHGWKLQEVNENGWPSPFLKRFDMNVCAKKMSTSLPRAWQWRPSYHQTVNQIRNELYVYDRLSAKVLSKEAKIHPFLTIPDIGECYPYCDAYT